MREVVRVLLYMLSFCLWLLSHVLFVCVLGFLSFYPILLMIGVSFGIFMLIGFFACG